MNLNHEQRMRLNTFLSNKKLDIPRTRRYVSENGTNWHWLQKNILVRNPDIPVEIKRMLGIRSL